MTIKSSITPAQRTYLDIALGTLIYAVVLGFCNDYTNLVEARSFSTIFFASIVLSSLTYGTLRLKDGVIRATGKNSTKPRPVLTIVGVWLILFLSKFVFLWAIEFVFSGAIIIRGFFGIFFIAALVTALQKGAETLFKKLGTAPQKQS